MGILKHIKEPDQATLLKLNILLEYVRDKNSFIFPIYIKDFIWRNIDDNCVVLNNEQIEVTDLVNRKYDKQEVIEIVNFFYERTPNWLRYGKDVMCKDIADVLEAA